MFLLKSAAFISEHPPVLSIVKVRQNSRQSLDILVRNTANPVSNVEMGITGL
jgi:hypothetical protein